MFEDGQAESRRGVPVRCSHISSFVLFPVVMQPIPECAQLPLPPRGRQKPHRRFAGTSQRPWQHLLAPPLHGRVAHFAHRQQDTDKPPPHSRREFQNPVDIVATSTHVDDIPQEACAGQYRSLLRVSDEIQKQEAPFIRRVRGMHARVVMVARITSCPLHYPAASKKPRPSGVVVV